MEYISSIQHINLIPLFISYFRELTYTKCTKVLYVLQQNSIQV